MSQGKIIKIPIKFSDLFLVFFWSLWSHFDDFSYCIDKVAKGHAAAYFYYWYNKSFDIIGWNDLSEPNCWQNCCSPVPSKDIFFDIGAVD